MVEFGNDNAAFGAREWLWWAVLEALEASGVHYVWVNVVAAIIFFGGLHYFAKRQPDPLGFLVLCLPILVINMPMSALRQAIAIGIILFALGAFLDKRTWLFVALVALASTFHSSAAIFILLAPLVGGRLSWARVAVTALLAIPGLALLLTSSQAEVAVTRYIEGDTDAFGAAFRSGLLGVTGMFYFLFLEGYWKRKSPADYSLVTIGALMMLMDLALVSVSSVIADRFGYYLIPIQTMIFIKMASVRTQRYSKALALAPYAGLFLFATVWFGLSTHFERCYVPYKSWILGVPESGQYIY